jgi:hypothetical protein
MTRPASDYKTTKAGEKKKKKKKKDERMANNPIAHGKEGRYPPLSPILAPMLYQGLSMPASCNLVDIVDARMSRHKRVSLGDHLLGSWKSTPRKPVFYLFLFFHFLDRCTHVGTW